MPTGSRSAQSAWKPQIQSNNCSECVPSVLNESVPGLGGGSAPGLGGSHPLEGLTNAMKGKMSR